MGALKELHIVVQGSCSSIVRFIDAVPAILKECKRLGYKPFFYEVAAEKCPDLSEKGVKAALVLGYTDGFLGRILPSLLEQGIHPIVVGNDFDGVGCSSVYYDRRATVSGILDYFRANERTKTALFGINTNAHSDIQRLSAFRERLGQSADKAVFYNNGSLQQAAADFAKRAHEYDSVVCANDMAAAILLCELSHVGVTVPDDLFVCGSGNTQLTGYTTPPLTSVSTDYSEVGKTAVIAYGLLQSMPSNTSARIAVEGVMNVRESTAMCPPTQGKRGNNMLSCPLEAKMKFVTDCDVVALDRINQALSQCDRTDLAILRAISSGKSRSDAAFDLYIGETTLRYRMEKLCRAAQCKDNSEFFALLKRYNIQVKEH